MGNCPGGPCSNLAEGGGRVHQTYSDDFGRTWSEPEDIADGLGDHPGLLPGPGSGGTQIPSGGVHGGRLVFVGWDMFYFKPPYGGALPSDASRRGLQLCLTVHSQVAGGSPK